MYGSLETGIVLFTIRTAARSWAGHSKRDSISQFTVQTVRASKVSLLLQEMIFQYLVAGVCRVSNMRRSNCSHTVERQFGRGIQFEARLRSTLRSSQERLKGASGLRHNSRLHPPSRGIRGQPEVASLRKAQGAAGVPEPLAGHPPARLSGTPWLPRQTGWVPQRRLYCCWPLPCLCPPHPLRARKCASALFPLSHCHRIFTIAHWTLDISATTHHSVASSQVPVTSCASNAQYSECIEGQSRVVVDAWVFR